MDTVDLGAIRLHVATAVPGLPGDAERVLRELSAVDPALVLADLDTDETIRLMESLGRSPRPFALSYVDGLLQEEVHRRYAGGERVAEHPLVAAARFARARHVPFVPLRPVTGDPGWIARRRGRSGVRALPADLAEPRAFADAFARVLGRTNVWHAEADVERAQARLHRALLDGRAPVVALVQAHRVLPFLASLRSIGRVAA